MRRRLSVPNGMLFVYDREAKGVEIPEYSENETVSQTESALSIAVTAEVDGEVEVDLLPLTAFQNASAKQITSGSIRVCKGSVSVCTMGDVEILSIPAKLGQARVIVRSNARQFPSAVYIYVEGP